MKKLAVRFTIYFTVGLLIFIVYLITMFSFLIRLFDPVVVNQFVYIVDSGQTLIKHILILLFCFITGGLLFSIFLVYPLIHILSAINNLSQGEYDVGGEKAAGADGKVKWPYFLYKEVIQNIRMVSQSLENSRQEQARLDESKNEWIAGVSHDLKTPLSYVTGYASLMMNRDHTWEVQDILPYIEEIYNKGMYMENLIEDLNFTFFMDHVDSSWLKLETLDLIAFLQNIMADIANTPKAEKYGLCFEHDTASLAWPFDAKLLHRAMYNLIMNALEHNPAETEITLSVQKQESCVSLTIKDNGVGMDADTLNNLFTRYHSNKNTIKSHRGLGLWIVKQIIEAHGGGINVDSIPGKGTAFHIVLPETVVH